MNEPMTWESYLQVRLLVGVAAFFAVLVLLAVALLVTWARSKLHCPEPLCDRRMVRRDGELRPFEGRYYCPFHDPRDEARFEVYRRSFDRPFLKERYR